LAADNPVLRELDRWFGEALGRAALAVDGDVPAVARTLSTQVAVPPEALVTAHMLRLERSPLDQAAWTGPETIDPEAFAAVSLELQADLLRWLWPIAAACGWRPTPPVAQ
jgi:hypothetical protein